MSGSRAPLIDHLFISYPDSQGVGIFGQKDNQHTLSPRASGNEMPPTVKPLTVRGPHKYFHTYNNITLRTLHSYQKHHSRYWEWYDEITNMVWLGGRQKKTMLTLFEDQYQTLLKRIGPQQQSSSLWPVLVNLWPASFLLPISYSQPCNFSIYLITYRYYKMSCFRNPFPQCLLIALWLLPLYGYVSPKVHPWSSNLTLVTTKLVGYP